MLRRPCRSARPLARCSVDPPEVKWNARDDDVRLEQERAFDEQCMLIVQEMLPDPSPHELRQDDRYIAARVLVLHLLDIFQERLHQRSVWRLQDDKIRRLTSPRNDASATDVLQTPTGLADGLEVGVLYQWR